VVIFGSAKTQGHSAECEIGRDDDRPALVENAPLSYGDRRSFYCRQKRQTSMASAFGRRLLGQDRKERAQGRRMPSIAGRCLQVNGADVCLGRILLKKSEIEPPRKSRFRARRVISGDSPHGRACRRSVRGKNRSLRRTPKQFSIKAASGLLNRDRCGNSSFSTQSAQ
jgi:hypothetical protein